MAEFFLFRERFRQKLSQGGISEYEKLERQKGRGADQLGAERLSKTVHVCVCVCVSPKKLERQKGRGADQLGAERLSKTVREHIFLTPQIFLTADQLGAERLSKFLRRVNSDSDSNEIIAIVII